jgi:flagellin
MSLGVLNNLTAMYAENNLNNTSNSLSKVLNQLSSGSKINSGADDAAGLSLVDGLQANSTALAQSQTNAQEGVGLLQVADGALSQVTSLLNRAVTLATEASNGTLNSSQDTAANNEYQSILSEINNIGTTTTYNGTAVFGQTSTNIYTGDSSTAGASVDSLNIQSLSSSNVGDSNGTMSYSNGTSNVFINLSNGGTNASVNDSLGAASATTTINVGYMTTGQNGSAVAASAQISVGAGTNYANSAEGLISAINSSGLGLSATFATATQAGSAAVTSAETAGGTGADTGIEISGSGIGTGTNGVGVVGSMALDSGDTLSGTLNIVGSDGTSHNIDLGTQNSTDNLVNLASTINSAGYGVTASVNQAGTALTFTSADSNVAVSGTNIEENTAASSSNVTIQNSNLGSLSVGGASDTLTGTLNVVSGTDGTSHTITLGTKGSTDNLADLAASFSGSGANAGLGISAALSNNGTTLSFTKSSSAADTPSISSSNVMDVAAPAVGVGSTLGSLSVASAGDTLSTSTSDSLTITSGITGQQSTITLGTAGSTDSLANLAKTINNGGYGITATVDKTGTDLTFTQTSGTDTAGVSGSALDTTYSTSATNPVGIVTGTTLGSITLDNANDTITTSAALDVNGTLNGTSGNTTVAAQTAVSLSTFAGLVNADTAATGVIASINSTAVDGHAAGTILTFTSEVSTTADPVTLTSVTGGGTITDNITAQNNTTGIVSQLGTLGTLSVNSATDQVGGTLLVGSGTSTYGGAIALAAVSTHQNQTLAEIANDFNSTTTGGTDTTQVENGGTALNDLGITATLNAAGTQITFSQQSGAANNVQTASVTMGAGTSHTITAEAHGASTSTLTATSATDLFQGNITGLNTAGTAFTQSINGLTVAQIADNFNNNNTLAGGTNANWSADGITATLVGNALTLHAANGSSTITASTVTEGVAGQALTEAPSLTTGATLGSLTATNASDTLTGAFTIKSGVTAGSTATTLNFSNQTLAQIEQTVNQGSYGITATLNSAVTNTDGTKVAAGTVLTFTQNASDAGTANITNNGTIVDTASAVSNSNLTVTNPGTGSDAVATVGTLGVASTANESDLLSGKLTLTEGVDANATQTTYSFTGQTLAEVAASFNSANGGQNAGLGITATINTSSNTLNGTTYAAGTLIEFTTTPGDADAGNVAVSGNSITDVTPATSSNKTVTTGTLSNTITVASASDYLTGDLYVTKGDSGGATGAVALTAGQTLQNIADDFNGVTSDSGATQTAAFDNLGITATLNSAGTELTFTQTLGDNVATGANIVSGSAASGLGTLQIQDQVLPNANATGSTATVSLAAGGTLANTLSVSNTTDTLTGSLKVTEGEDGTLSQSTFNLNGMTLQEVANAFNSGQESTLGITASINQTAENGLAAGTVLTFTESAGATGANVVDASKIADNVTTTSSNTVNVASGTMLDTMSVNNSSDTLGGTLNLTNGYTKATDAITLGTQGKTDTLADLASTINSGTYGITATLNNSGTELTFTQNSGDGFAATVSGTSVTDTGSDSLAASTNLGTLKANTATDTMTGTLQGVGSDGSTAYSLNLNGKTMSEVESAINSDSALGITASLDKSGTQLSFTADASNSGTATIGNYGNITDTTVSTQTAVSITSTPTTGVANSSTLGSLTIAATDTLSGSMTIGGQTLNIGSSDNTAATLASTIDKGSYGVQAAYDSNSGQLTFTSSNSSMAISTSSLNESTPGSTTDTAVGSLTGAYTSSGYYSRGITGTVTDTSTAGGTKNVGITTDANGSGGIATISYKDGAGQSLSASDLSNQSDAKTALNEINAAITDVAAQDGYVGAQINTLNSVSSVLSTQQENVVSAQNAVQATDYASATSNMSKYEILSQTGIAALAQANSQMQAVTKLLQ